MMDLCLWQLDFLDVIELVLLIDIVHQWYYPKSAFVPPPSDDWLAPRQYFHICRVIHFNTFVSWSKYRGITIGSQDRYTDKDIP